MESFLQDIPLDKECKETLSKWYQSFTTQSNKPYVLSGNTGIGKTYLAKRILEGTDIIEITEPKKIIEQIDMIITKRNIQMMFQTIDKSILIDNVSKKSKYNLKDILTVLKTKYKYRIVIVLDDMNAIKLKKNMNHYSLNYTPVQLWTIVKHYVDQWKVTLNEDNFYFKLKTGGSNLHNILSEIKYYRNSTIPLDKTFMDDCEKDNIKNASKLVNTTQSFQTHYPQPEIILLNIIHNISQYDTFEQVFPIYERYMIHFKQNIPMNIYSIVFKG